jgi:hypothetical protein
VNEKKMKKITVKMQSSAFFSGNAEIGSFAVKVELDQDNQRSRLFYTEAT